MSSGVVGLPETTAAKVTQGTYVEPPVAPTDVIEKGKQVFEQYGCGACHEKSILYPNYYIAPQCPTGSCPAGLMIQNFKDSDKARGTERASRLSHVAPLKSRTQ